MYDLQGRRITHLPSLSPLPKGGVGGRPGAGIYILNGKKVIL